MEKNPSIQCVVRECRYHADKSDYCTLERIKVGKNDAVSNKVQDTDCQSFQTKSDSVH